MSIDFLLDFTKPFGRTESYLSHEVQSHLPVRVLRIALPCVSLRQIELATTYTGISIYQSVATVTMEYLLKAERLRQHLDLPITPLPGLLESTSFDTYHCYGLKRYLDYFASFDAKSGSASSANIVSGPKGSKPGKIPLITISIPPLTL